MDEVAGEVECVKAMMGRLESNAKTVKKPSPTGTATSRPPRDQQRALIAEGAIPTMLATAVPFSESVGAPGFHDWLAEFLLDAGDPADPVVRLLLQQIAFAHFRVGYLHALAESSTQVDAAGVFATAAARLTAEFRRLVLALAEYREVVGTSSPARRRRLAVASQSSASSAVAEVPSNQARDRSVGNNGASTQKQAAVVTPAETTTTRTAADHATPSKTHRHSTPGDQQQSLQTQEFSCRDSKQGSNGGGGGGGNQPRPEPPSGGGWTAEPGVTGAADVCWPPAIAGDGDAEQAMELLYGPPDDLGKDPLRRERPQTSEVGIVRPTAPSPGRRGSSGSRVDGGLPSDGGDDHRKQKRVEDVNDEPEKAVILAGGH